MLLGGEVFGRYLDLGEVLRVESPMTELVSFYEERETRALFLSQTCEDKTRN